VYIKGQLIENVAHDIRYLQREWHQNINNHALRRGSAVLRGLLVQGQLQRAWKGIGFEGQPQIITSSLSEILAKVPIVKIVFAASGGAIYKGVGIRGAIVVDRTLMTESGMKVLESMGFPEETVELVSFIESPCIVAEGNIVQRRMLVKYVADALGGTHFVTSRTRKKTGKIYSLLDRAAEKFRYEDKNLVYFELLSIGQAIAKSSDVNSFCEKVGA
jgi:hypothetical protein